MSNIEDVIDRLWMNSGHGTRKSDVKMIWNEAIKHAAKIVSDNYDEMEPWLEVGDIEALYYDKKEDGK